MTTKNLPTNAELMSLIRQTASEEFNSRIPTDIKTNIEATINAITTYPTVKNEFISALTNVVGKQIFLSKLYENPFKFFKKGSLPYGKTVEAIFIDLIKAKSFKDVQDTNEVTALIGTEKPTNVKVEYYTENYQKMYKLSLSDSQLKGAFRSETGLSELLQRELTSALTSAEFDEFLMVKQVLNNVALKEVTLSGFNALSENEQAKKLTKALKTYINKFRFLSDAYNTGGVHTHSKPEDLVILVTPETKANIDVELLSSAFNMSKAEIESRLVLIDQFTKQDTISKEVSNDEDTLAILCDIDLVQFYETENTTDSIRIPTSLKTNTFFHRWGIMCGCSYVNAIKVKKA